MWEDDKAENSNVPCMWICGNAVCHSDPLSVATLTVNTATSTGVEYRVERSGSAMNDRIITGNEVFRFGVPMIGEYVNAGRGRRVTISPAVPGAQYSITAWALDSGTRRSAIPVLKSVITEGIGECKF